MKGKKPPSFSKRAFEENVATHLCLGSFLWLGGTGSRGNLGSFTVNMSPVTVVCRLQLLSLIPLQTGLGEPVKCNFTVTESRVSSRSVSLQWRTLGSPCNFSLIYNNDTSEVAWCHPMQIDNTTYGCNPKDLQAGTIYHFRIVSLDGEERTEVLQTGKGDRCSGMARALRAEPCLFKLVFHSSPGTQKNKSKNVCEGKY